MYFLIGLGIIVIIVYGNMLYDRIKTNKNKDTTDVEKSAGTADNHLLSKRRRKVRRLKSIGRRRIRINPGAWSKQQRILLFQAQR